MPAWGYLLIPVVVGAIYLWFTRNWPKPPR